WFFVCRSFFRCCCVCFFFQAEDGIRDFHVTGVQTCALPIFFFDEKAQFIEGYYVVGLLAQNFLKKNPGAKIIHDPRLVWNTQDIVASAGGTAIESKTGHAFIKQRMRDEDAVYGGEMSAHHYFKPFAYCD